MSETRQQATDSHRKLSLWTDQKHLVYECFHFAVEYANRPGDDEAFSDLQELFAELGRRSSCGDETHRLEELNAFFFDQQGFSVAPADHPAPAQLLTEILCKKSGNSHLLKLLYAALAGSVGLQVEFICDAKHDLLKVYLDGRSQVLDFRRQACFLEPHELVEAVNSGVDFTVCDRGEKTLIRYFYSVKKFAQRASRLHHVVLANRYLMRWQPFNLRHIRERAQIAYKTGDYLRAAEDIRSYFVYKSPEIKSLRLNRLYRLSLLKK